MAKLTAKSGLLAASTGPELDVTSSWKRAHQKAMKKHATSGKKWIHIIGWSLSHFLSFSKDIKN
jgi:hypothetical protein